MVMMSLLRELIHAIRAKTEIQVPKAFVASNFHRGDDIRESCRSLQ